MSTRKHGIATWLLVAAAAIAITERGHGQREPQRPEVRGMVKSRDAGNITLTIAEGREQPAVEKTFTLAKNVEVAIGSGIGRGGFFKEGKLADLGAGVRVSLTLSVDGKTVESIAAEAPIVRGEVKAVDAAKKTLTIVGPAGREQPGEEKTYTVGPEAEVAADDGRGGRFSIREAKLADLAPGAQVTAWLSLDQKQVQAVLAEGPTLFGTIKAVDAVKKSLTLVRPARGDDAAEEKKLTVSSDAVVLVDDGKGRRLSVKLSKLADLPVGAMAAVKLSVDQTVVMSIRAEGPSLTALFKGVDAGKGVILVAIPKGRDEPEEKTLSLAKDVRVAIDGTAAKLADLKAVDGGPMLQLRMSLDQKTVQVIMAWQARRER